METKNEFVKMLLGTAALFFCGVLNAGCTFFSETENVCITLPDDSRTYCVKWICEDNSGNGVCRVLDNCCGSVILELPKNYAVPVLVFSGASEAIMAGDNIATVSEYRNQYGMIYPYTVGVSEKDAFASSVLFTMYAASSSGLKETEEYLSSFNWGKFIELCDEYENPWKLNKQKIMEAIADGSFSKKSMCLSGS